MVTPKRSIDTRTIVLTEARRVLTCTDDPASASALGGSPALTQPGGVAVLSDDMIAVADQGDGRLGLLAPGASSWTTVFRVGSGVGELRAPMGLSVDGSDRLLIADRGNRRIVRTDVDGSAWVTFGSGGTGAGRFVAPTATAVDDKGRVYVADPGARRVIRVDAMTGAGWTELPHAGGQPWGVAAGAGWWAVADAGTRSVTLYDGDDALLASSDPALPLLAPTMVAGDGETLVVADPTANDVWLLSAAGGVLSADRRLRGSDPLLPAPAWEQLGGVTLGRTAP